MKLGVNCTMGLFDVKGCRDGDWGGMNVWVVSMIEYGIVSGLGWDMWMVCEGGD